MPALAQATSAREKTQNLCTNLTEGTKQVRNVTSRNSNPCRVRAMHGFQNDGIQQKKHSGFEDFLTSWQQQYFLGPEVKYVCIEAQAFVIAEMGSK